MQARQPSRTAVGAAAHRAAHQISEAGRIFKDPFAAILLDEKGRALIDEYSSDRSQRPMRLFMAARSRFAEDALASAFSRGVRQAVILGAGLDTFALRNPHDGLNVFEVDHPATQVWKRDRFKQAGLTVPGSLTFTPVDFESQSLADCLPSAGFRSDLPAFFLWLGVTIYLTQDAIAAALDFIASVPGSEVVFDYSEPLENYPPERRAKVAAVAARAAAIGEPWLSRFDPAELSGDLRLKGFEDIEDLGFADIARRYFTEAMGDVRDGAGPHLIRARRAA
jgi:methyltransferase (TIGR00027 family)